MRRLLVLIVSFFLIASAAAYAQTGASTAQLEKDIPELMKKAEVPGLSIALIRHGKITWVRGFGVKNAATKEPVSDDTVFEAASLSKPVFAYGVLKLVDQGRIDLDRPLVSYLPYPDVEGDDRLGKITARLVLSHRSGFPNWRNDKLKIFFTPGERFSYSGEGMVYLQKVVEKITGQPLNEYMKQAVFQPLGMTSSSYLWRSDYVSHMATGHNADGEPQELWKPDKEVSASSLHITARDYAVFVEAVLHGRGLKPANGARNGKAAGRGRSRMRPVHRPRAQGIVEDCFLGTWLGNPGNVQRRSALALG